MKKITLLTLMMLCFCFSFAQVGISENFDSGLPADWTTNYANSPNGACAGNSERGNLWSYVQSADLTSPNFVGASNGTDMTISFDYKIVNYNFSNPTVATPAGWGTADIQFSIDNGTTWQTNVTIDDSNHVVSNECVTFSTSIEASFLPAGSDIQLRIFNTWASGDYYFYVDNFVAAQVAANPPNCDSVLSETVDVSIDGDISWSSATGVPTGYFITAGTTSGGNDLADNVNNMNSTSYELGTLAQGTTYYVTITPYNANGSASDCVEQTFVTDTYVEGEICEFAIDVTLPYSEASGTTAGFGDDYTGSPGSTGCGTTSSYLNGDDIVYSYTATSDTQISIDLTPEAGNTWSGVFVYTDCEDIGTACVAGVGSSNTDVREIDLDVTSGVTYYIVISTFAAPQTVNYGLEIFENTCVDATATYTVVNDCDVSGGFVIDVEITDLGSATSIVLSNDQDSETFTATAVGTFQFGPFVNGTDVVITLDDQNDDDTCTLTSDVLTQAACPPENDECDNAISLTVNADLECGEVTSGTIASATASSTDPTACGGTEDDDVWFSFVASNVTHNISLINIANGTTDLYHSVWSGTCGSLTNLSCSDPNTSVISGLTIGETYLLRVYSWTSTAGQTSTFDVCIGTPAPPPANDLCEDALPLPISDASCNNSISGTTQSAGASTTGCTGGRDVWYSFTASETRDYVITETETFDSGFSSTYIAAYEGTCEALTQIGSSTSCTFSGDLVISAISGTTYYISVRSSSSTSYVEFDLCVYPEPTCFAPEDLAATFVAPNSADISWTAPTDGTVPADYNWEVVPQGNDQGVGVISSGTTADLFATATGLVLDTMYDLRVQSNCGAGDLSAWSEPFTFNAGYCIPFATSSSSFIDDFSTSGDNMNISNLGSGLATDNYENNTGTMAVSGAQNDVIDFEIAIVGGTIGAAVWVDWNNDFVFDTSEVSYSTTSYGNGPFTGAITIPDGVSNGDYRMRVLIDWNDSNPGDDDACSYGSSTAPRGETEDYTVTVDSTLSLGDISNQYNFTYFPNPVKNTLTLKAQNTIDSVLVLNMLGQEVMKTSPNSLSSDLDMSQLQTGTYFVQVSIDGQLETIKVLRD
ncbi:GEVED domain-containing protein [Psychroserpens sp. Hel_I_66]|uniref:GEVED domain-containing protein n=1 Tax=Psychroserpens sp. Hel_I_66 TaxID=1250004 RepID=UPI000646C3A0|nr:GEVED domain-containing protein [Psychroserpens sp. Hel_I_66]